MSMRWRGHRYGVRFGSVAESGPPEFPFAAAEVRMTLDVEPDATEEMPSPSGIVGPGRLTGHAGRSARARWGVAILETGFEVEWITEGRVLAAWGGTATIDFDLAEARPGQRLTRTIRAVLRGPNSQRECPAFFVEIEVV